jgi:hypothetical protein
LDDAAHRRWRLTALARDIFDLREIVQRSEEHVLLSAFGGKLVSSDLIDKRTNDLFGRSIDAALARSLQTVRVILDARSGDGKSPPKVRGVAADGTELNILPGGFHMEPTKPNFRVWKADGVTHAGGSVRSMDELKRLLARVCREEGVTFEQTKFEATPSKTVAPPLSFGMSFGVECYRAVAKMACNLFARSNRDAFLSKHFDAIRRFVISGEGQLADFVQFNVRPLDLAIGAIGDLDHLLVVHEQRDGVIALVCLFAHLQFLVRLSGGGRGDAVAAAYRVDQLTGAHRVDARPDLALEFADFECVASVPYEAVLDAYEAAMNRLLPIVVQKQDQVFVRALIADAVRECARPDRTVSLEDVVAVVVRRYMQHAAERVRNASPPPTE